jgi:hypothetical protein
VEREWDRVGAYSWKTIVREFDVYAPDQWLTEETVYDDDSRILKGKDYNPGGPNHVLNAGPKEWRSFEERYDPNNNKYWESYTYYATAAEGLHTILKKWDFNNQDWANSTEYTLGIDQRLWKVVNYDSHADYSQAKWEWQYAAGEWSERITYKDKTAAQNTVLEHRKWTSDDDTLMKEVIKKWDYTTAVAWSEHEMHYRRGQAFGLEKEIIRYDNGTYSEIFHDLDNMNTSWNRHEIIYKTSAANPGEKLYELYIYDNNRVLVEERDLLNANTWNQRTTKHVISDTGQWLTYYLETINDRQDGHVKKVIHEWEQPGESRDWKERTRTYYDNHAVSRDEIIYSDTYKTLEHWDRLGEEDWWTDEKEYRDGNIVRHKTIYDGADKPYTIWQTDYSGRDWHSVQTKGGLYNNSEAPYFKVTRYDENFPDFEYQKEFWDPGDFKDWDRVYVELRGETRLNYYTVLDGGLVVPRRVPVDVIDDAWDGLGSSPITSSRYGQALQDLYACDLNSDGTLDSGRELELANPLLDLVLGVRSEMIL